MSASNRPTLGDRLQARVARFLLSRSPMAQLRIAGGAPVTCDAGTLDPGVQMLLAMQRRRGIAGLMGPDPITARARFRREMLAWAGAPIRVGEVRDFTIPGFDGPIGVRHYAPRSARRECQPLLVYLHGGGFLLGDLDVFDQPCRLLCAESDMHVLSVEYRLAPEHPFPAALDDARAALEWAWEHAGSLGAHSRRVAIGGDGAGANLAAVMAQHTASTGGAPIAQLLITPPVDAEGDYPSRQAFGAGYFLTEIDRLESTAAYLRGSGITTDDPRVSPLRAPTLAGVAPACVVTCAFDLHRDEGETYADALRAAGVPLRTLRIGAHGHGFVNLVGVSASARAALAEVARGWRAFVDELP